MPPKPINILVYSGTGVSQNSLQHTIFALRQLLQPHYAVLPLQTDTLLNEPWPSTCAALVFPGGGDVGYCRALNGAGNRKIRSYVSAGGVYMGFCAGGYYGSAKCEWELGAADMEVVGDRELAFFPGICRGSVFGGFKYGTEAGTKAAMLKVNHNAFNAPASLPQSFRSYFNGGGVFVDASRVGGDSVDILASYDGDMAVDGGDSRAAIVQCKVGDGVALLTGPHPEFVSDRLSKHAKGMDPAVVDALAEDEHARRSFLRACLLRLDLQVEPEDEPPLALTRIHLSSSRSGVADSIIDSWTKTAESTDTGARHIKDGNDVFDICSADTVGEDRTTESLKQIVVHRNDPPSSTQTPCFNHETYFSALRESELPQRPGFSPIRFGKTLLYGQVVTSTSTLLEKNPLLTAPLPEGTTLVATRQLSGRGRGANVWVSPAGSLLFSTVFSHPLTLNKTAPLVFVQYLAGMAVVEAIRTYADDGAYEPFSRCIRLKWPNDVYALHPANIAGASNAADHAAFVKIAGVLVNTSYAAGDFRVVLGIGLNVSNAAPTTSLAALLSAWNGKRDGSALAPFEPERLLARTLACFALLYAHFCAAGFAGDVAALYYRHWLHAGQTVALEAEGGVRARVLGVTSDWGLLLAEAVDGSGERFALQSDGNSFDFFRGLIRRKV